MDIRLLFDCGTYSTLDIGNPTSARPLPVTGIVAPFAIVIVSLAFHSGVMCELIEVLAPVSMIQVSSRFTSMEKA